MTVVATDWVTLIPSIVAAGGAVFAAVFAFLASRRSKATFHEVQTMNELTIGQLGEAAETRRITDKPVADRTSREKRHTDASEERSTGA